MATETGGAGAAPDAAEAARLAVEQRQRLRSDGRDYFEEKYDKTLAAMLRANAATTWRRIGAVVLGLILVGTGLATYWAGYRAFLMQEVLIAIAGLILIAWAALYLRRGKEGSLRDAEKGLDELSEHDLDTLIARADERLAFVGDVDLKQKLVLRGFPDRLRLPGAFFGGRIGSDGRTRFSPVGVTVFALGKETVAAYKGAIDLTSGDILYERLVEFPYRDIRALELVVSTRGETGAEVEPPKKVGPMRAMANAAARRARAQRPQKDKEALVVHLSTAVRVESVLVDRGFVDAWKGEKLGLISPIETEEHCRAVWQTLRERWRAALAG